MCPWNEKFSLPLAEPAFAPRPAVSGKEARSLALELLTMSQAEFSAAFRGSPMKRAKLRGLRRNASVVLGNVGSSADVHALVEALSGEEPLVRGHASWALGRIGSPAAVEPLRKWPSSEEAQRVAEEMRSALSALSG